MLLLIDHIANYYDYPSQYGPVCIPKVTRNLGIQIIVEASSHHIKPRHGTAGRRAGRELQNGDPLQLFKTLTKLLEDDRLCSSMQVSA